jgi:predicted NUDIX family NTP pyrophosphohydrolase
MAKQSAGILLYRRTPSLEVLLVHPGGPFFARKDLGSWSIPKGEVLEGEDPLQAAIREFFEETGTTLSGAFMPLESIRQKGGKAVQAWALEGDLDVSRVVSNTFTIAWPPGSGRQQTFPEIDKAQWFSPVQAREKINEAQRALIEDLAGRL